MWKKDTEGVTERKKETGAGEKIKRKIGRETWVRE